MATASEPALPQERAAEGLEPKSYAEAAEGNSEDHGTTPADRLKELKADGTTTNGVAEPKSNSTASKSSDAAKSSSPSPSPSKRPGSGKSNRVNSAIASLYGNTVTNKEYEEANGHRPTTTTSPRPHKAQLELDRRERAASRHSVENKHQDPLVSGRRAGASWSASRIRWAPLNVPLQRRLQTLMVLMHGLSIAALLALFLFLCAIPLLWPILVPYLIHSLLSTASTSGNLSRRSERLRRSSVWSLFSSYFPARLHRSAILPPTRKYVFGYHPHGIISFGAFAAFSTEALGFAQLFPGITNTLLTLDTNFRIPLYRDYILAMGLRSVSKESCENLLSKGGPNGEGMGRAITIVVGGARESLDAEPASLRLVLKRRKGFVKLAIRNGADLVPVLGFGENDLYEQFQPDKHPFVHRAQLMVKRAMGFTIPLFHARGVFNYDVGLLPYRRPLNIVVGNPIPVEQNRKPDDRLVEELHARYIEELQRLWDENKDLFAPDRTSELEIIE